MVVFIGSSEIKPTFLAYLTEELAETNTGLSGSQIVRITLGYAQEYGVELPHPRYPFDAPNKRTALYENLSCFSGPQQYRILSDLIDHPSFSEEKRHRISNLKARLVADYGHLSGETEPHLISNEVVESTRHWLDAFPDCLVLYNQALQKYQHKIFRRNVLDDVRLCLEKLLQEVLENQKSLENQLPALGQFLKSKGGSTELVNMFRTLLDYYAKYQNTYVKHDDAVIEQEVEFVLEISSCFMKHLARY